MTEKNGKIDFRNPARLEAEKRRKQIAALYLEYKSKAVDGLLLGWDTTSHGR